MGKSDEMKKINETDLSAKDGMCGDDVIAVEELAYFYEHAYCTGGHLHQIPPLFCLETESGLHTHANRKGHEAVKAQYVEYYDGTPLYDTYHCGQQICTPVIEINGETARASSLRQAFLLTAVQAYRPVPFQIPHIQSIVPLSFGSMILFGNIICGRSKI